MHPLIQTTLEIILTNVIGIAATIVSFKLYQWLGIQVDEKRRAYLEIALQNGLRLAIHKLSADDADDHEEWDEFNKAILQVALDYTKQNVPDALRKLKIEDEQLLSILEARLPMMLEAIALELSH